MRTLRFCAAVIDSPMKLFRTTGHHVWRRPIRVQCIRLHHGCHKSLQEGPGLRDFIAPQSPVVEPILAEDIPYLHHTDYYGHHQKVYFEVYGCQMNVNDTEVIWSILKQHGYQKVEDLYHADVVLIVTCAIREKAEEKIWGRLAQLRTIKRYGTERKRIRIGLLGCMAERLKQKVLEIEKSVDLVAGPDSYKDLPRLLALTQTGQTAVNVILSLDETYADVMPVRLNENTKTAFVSVMRGCDNMCTYCIVPFTRGRERSRPISSILEEVKKLSDQGIKEVTLLGQNVNSYRDTSVVKSYDSPTVSLAKGFKTVYKPKLGGLRFDTLLDQVSRIDPEMRIRFTSPHPKDFPDEVLHLIKERKNICKCVHLPAQSGSSAVLERMRRGYTREAYMELVEHMRSIIPDISLSSDFISGFCGETEEEFQETLTLMDLVRYNLAYTFAYSMREKTTAHRRYADDVPKDVKLRRCAEMGNLYREKAQKLNEDQIGQIQLVLVEGVSKRSNDFFAGRNDANTKVIIPSCEVSISPRSSDVAAIKPGDYIAVLINGANSLVLQGTPLCHTTINDFDPQVQPLNDPVRQFRTT